MIIPDFIYEPREDSKLMKKHIKDYAKGFVLDMGTGSAVQAIESSKYAKKVLAVDVDENIIEWCNDNIDKRKIEFQQSDLFNRVEGRFDLITFNPPYLPDDEGIKDKALYGGKYGCETIIKFLREAADYLVDNGKILLIFTSFSKPEKIIETMKKLDYKYKIIDKVHISFEDIFLYKIKK